MKAPISRFTVSGNSMVPSLHPGQDVLSFNWAYLGRKPKIGDIVVIKVNGREIVKRIQSISDRNIYVVGDNVDESTDSRDFGPVSMEQVVGKVVYIDPPLADDMIECLQCSSPVIGIYGRKDAICRNCGFKMVCCGE